MRPVTILLGVVVILLGVVLVQQRQTARVERDVALKLQEETNKALQATQADLTASKARQDQLAQQVTGLESTRAALEQQRAQAQQQVETLKQELAEARKVVPGQPSAADCSKVNAERDALAAQLRSAQEQVATTEKALNDTIAKLAACSTRQVALEMELNSLRGEWNSLDAVAARLRALKKQRREERIANEKRLEREASILGNHGLLLRDGKWTSVQP